MLPKAGFDEPLFVFLIRVVQRMQFEDTVYYFKLTIFSIKVDNILKVSFYQTFELRCLLFEILSNPHVVNHL